MAYDNWKTTEPDHNADKEPPADTGCCALCGDPVDEFGCLVEAFEATGKIICEGCFDEHCALSGGAA